MSGESEEQRKPQSFLRQLSAAPKYTCKFAGCDLQFKRKDRLDAHEFTHSQVKKFQCTEPDCSKIYATNSHLQRHKRTSHNGNKEKPPFFCTHESCEQFFDTKAHMQLHYRFIHSEKAYEYECEQCHEKFRRKNHLKEHVYNTHTGNYPYTCSKCNKGFFLMSKLTRHELSHQKRQCEQCDATFDKWSALMAHKHKEHVSSDLKCSICNREFNSKRLLKIHRKIHTNSDDRLVHQCPFEGCTKNFLQRHNMLTHYKLKHENRTFACTFGEGCTAVLCTKQKLNLHIKAVHLTNGKQIDKSAKKANGERARRKDKGMQRISTASKFFNVILPKEFERAIIDGQGKDIHIEYEHNEHNIDDANADADADAKGGSDNQNQEFNHTNTLTTVSFSSPSVLAKC